MLAISNPSVSEYPCLRFPGTRTNEVARQFWTCAREMPKREPHKCLRIRVLRRGRRVKGGTGTRNNLHGPYNIYLMPRTLFPFFACSSSPTNKLTLSGREGHSETSVSTVRVACVYAARCPGHRVLALIPGFCRQMTSVGAQVARSIMAASNGAGRGMLPIGSVGMGIVRALVSTPCTGLEIQAQSQLDLPRRSREAGRAKRRIRRTAYAISEALRNRPEERRRPVDGVNGIDVRTIK